MTEQTIMSRLETSMTMAFLSAPMLMFPIIGQKRIGLDRQTYSANPGQVLPLLKGVRCDVENSPELGQSRFLGASLFFDRQTIDLFRKIYSDGLKDWDLTPKWKAAGSDELYSIIADWITHRGGRGPVPARGSGSTRPRCCASYFRCLHRSAMKSMKRRTLAVRCRVWGYTALMASLVAM